MKYLKFFFGESSDEPLIVESRTVFSLFAVLLVILVIIFSVGYYYGKRAVLNEFVQHIDQESFADRVFTSLCTIYETGEEEKEREEEAAGAEGGAEQSLESTGTEEPIEPEYLYYADLVGFATQTKAEAYARKLRKEGVSVKVRERMSTSAKGKARAWYQVVTYTMKKQELENLVVRLAQRDHLNDIKIHEFIAQESTQERQVA